MTIAINDVYGLLALLVVVFGWLAKTVMEWRIQVAIAARKQAQLDSMSLQAQVATVLGERHPDAIGKAEGKTVIGF